MTGEGAVVGVVGTGNIGAMRARLLAGHAGIRRVLVNDVDGDSVARLAAEHPGVLIPVDLPAMLADPALAGIVVATRARQQADLALEALAAGVPVLVEKPFTGDASRAREVVAAATSAATDVYAGYTQRFRRKFLNGYEQVRSGHLGTIRGVFARFHATRAVAVSTLAKSDMASPATVLGPHLLDLLTWYVGGRLPEVVLARTTTADITGTGRQVPATTWMLLDYGDFLADVVLSWQLPAEHPAVHASIHLEVTGSDGYLVLDDSHTDVLVSATRPIEQVATPYTGASVHRAAFLGSYPPGDLVMGTIHGPVRDETYAFAEVISRAVKHPVLATGAEAAVVAELVSQIAAAEKASAPLEEPASTPVVRA